MTTMTTPTGVEHNVTGLVPSRYNHTDTWETPAILTVDLGSGPAYRFGLGFVGADGECRRTTGGPMLAGPYAYAYGLATVIDNYGGSARELDEARTAGRVIDARIGDVLVFRGSRFLIERAANRNVELTLLPDREVEDAPTGGLSIVDMGLLVHRLQTLVTRYNQVRAWHDLCDRAAVAARAAGQYATGEAAAEVIGNKRPPSKSTVGWMYDDAAAVMRILGDTSERPHDLAGIGAVIDKARAAIAGWLDNPEADQGRPRTDADVDRMRAVVARRAAKGTEPQQ